MHQCTVDDPFTEHGVRSYHRQNIFCQTNICNSFSLKLQKWFLHQNKVELNQKSKSDLCMVHTVAGSPRRPRVNTLHVAERTSAAGRCLWSLLCLSDWRFAGSCCLVTMWQMQGQMAACARCRHLVLSPPPPSCLNAGDNGARGAAGPGSTCCITLQSPDTLTHAPNGILKSCDRMSK